MNCEDEERMMKDVLKNGGFGNPLGFLYEYGDVVNRWVECMERKIWKEEAERLGIFAKMAGW